jgi:hypothetical protein
LLRNRQPKVIGGTDRLNLPPPVQRPPQDLPNLTPDDEDDGKPENESPLPADGSLLEGFMVKARNVDG